jgi:transposase-like protein
MTSSTKSFYAGHRFLPELISYTVWLYYRFPLSLRMVEEMLAFRGIEVSHETIRQWGSSSARSSPISSGRPKLQTSHGSWCSRP